MAKNDEAVKDMADVKAAPKKAAPKTPAVKKVAKKTAVRKKIAPKPTVAKETPPKPAQPEITPAQASIQAIGDKKTVSKTKVTPKQSTAKISISSEERRLIIALRAYYRWLDSGCGNSDDTRHWLDAEKEVNDMFG